MHEINLNSASDKLFSNEELLLDINYSKLKNLGIEYFPSIKAKQTSFEVFITKINEHFSLNIPKEFNELFLPLEETKYFWLSNHPLVVSLENFFHPFNKRNLKSYSEKEEFKRYYIKWANESSPKEKNFFATTIKNLIERNSSVDDIMKNLLFATLWSYDDKPQAEEKFLSQYNFVNNTILNSAIGEDLKNEYLYYENLFKAVHFINKKNYQEAIQFLSTALGLKENGINVNYYRAMLLNKESEIEVCMDMVKSLVLFDVDRLNYANSINNKQLFDYFLKNSVAINIFSERRFSDLVFRIKSLFESLGANNRNSFKFIEISIDKLKGIDLKNFLNDALIAELTYIENFVKEYEKEKIVYMKIIDIPFLEKYHGFIDKIKLRIKETEEKKITEEMVAIHKRIQAQQDEIEYLRGDSEKWKEKASVQLKETIKANEDRYAGVVSQVETVLSKLDSNQEFDPYTSFNNSLIYNFIISMIVFIIGGFIDGISDGNELKASGLIVSVFSGGLKWSAIVFIVGLFIAVIGMVSKMVEKSNEKQRLMRKISQLKSEAERETEKIKKENEQKIKEYENSSKMKIEKAKDTIEALQKEKVSRDAALRGEMEKKIAKIYETIDAILI